MEEKRSEGKGIELKKENELEGKRGMGGELERESFKERKKKETKGKGREELGKQGEERQALSNSENGRQITASLAKGNQGKRGNNLALFLFRSYCILCSYQLL